ncbi:FIG00483136: hypothetical protein [hydrothermal vent metagenome]|uniref:DUF2336 domain-containing protein n=2 Tax=hydrothermal vent metagenome TaxID=652676 RepID=A0A3B0RLY9_9ZZZZ
MKPVAPAQLETLQQAAPIGRARTALIRRLSDLVCLPETKISPVERHMTGDLLMDMLRETEPALRKKCAQRVSALGDAPPLLLRMLAMDDIEIAAPVLENSATISDADLVSTAKVGGPKHRLLIARRKKISEMVAEELTSHMEADVAKVLLQNQGAKLSSAALENLVGLTKGHTALCRLLLSRPELRPSQGFTLFWWANEEDRKRIFLRFSVDRVLMQETAQDVFALNAAEQWQDPLARKAMQFIERRQRNRAAIARSPFDSLEHAIDAAVVNMNTEIAEEISYLSGIKPITGARILADTGGEPVAILCKATGLKRPYLAKLWTAMKHKTGTDAAPDPGFERVRYTFDTMSSNKAQTVLRYWNWALSSSLSSDLRRRIREGKMGDISTLSAPERAASLVFGQHG